MYYIVVKSSDSGKYQMPIDDFIFGSYIEVRSPERTSFWSYSNEKDTDVRA